MRYVWKDYPPQETIVEGERVVKTGTLDEVLAYAEKIKGLKLPYHLTRPTSWRHLIVGIYSCRGVMDPEYSPSSKKIQDLVMTTPMQAFLEISLLYKERKLPDDWIVDAVDIARGSKYQYKIYDICNKKVSARTTWKWLNSSERHLRLAGLWVCSVKTGLLEKYYRKCAEMRIAEPKSSEDFLINEKVKAAETNGAVMEFYQGTRLSSL